MPEKIQQPTKGINKLKNEDQINHKNTTQTNHETKLTTSSLHQLFFHQQTKSKHSEKI